MTTRSNLGVDWITTKGLPSGYYQNGSEIGSSVYLKPTQTVTPAYTGLLTTIPTGSVGLYALKWINNNYTGPIFKIRNGTTNTTQDFYMDKTGDAIGTAVNGTGTSLTTFLNGAIAYIDTWYDQSMQTTPKNATQTNTALQPTYDLSTKSISISSTSYLNIANIYGTGNINYTIIYKSVVANNLVNGGATQYPTIFTTGTQGPPPSTNQSIYLICSKTDVQQDWYGTADFSYGRTATNNEVITNLYNTTSRYIFRNGTQVATDTPATKINIGTGTSYIGFYSGAATPKFTGNIGFLCLFNTALQTADRLIMEGI